MARQGLTPQTVPDDAYDATTWNGNTEVPTKNAIRDKIESMGGGGDMLQSTYDPANVNQQLVGTTATQTMTNKTLTSPVISTPRISSSIKDSGGSDILALSASFPSVNFLSVSNSSTGVAPGLSANGTDTNVSFNLTTKGSGVVQANGAEVATLTSGSLPVTKGGTGRTTATTAYGLIAAGTTDTGVQQTVSPGTSGQILKSNGASALPTFQTGAKADVGLGNVDNTSDATKNAAAATLTNKTLTTPVIDQFGTASGLGAQWNTWSPTITAGSGTFTSTSATGARYKQIGKTIHFRVDVNINTVGTGIGLNFTLPVTAQASAAMIGYAREDATSGLMGAIKLNSSTVAGVLRYDNGNIVSGGSGSVVRCAGTYEAA